VPERHRIDFPIAWDDDQAVTRREFGRFVAATSVSLAIGTLWRIVGMRLGSEAPTLAPTRIARIEEIPVGGYRLFRFPTEHDPAILLRLDAERFVAFSQRCTHLGCPVRLEAATRRLHCPCHEGYFASDDGRVLGGPPSRPLPHIGVEVRDGAVFAVSA
jgi:Rieske Fe-S protein